VYIIISCLLLYIRRFIALLAVLVGKLCSFRSKIFLFYLVNQVLFQRGKLTRRVHTHAPPFLVIYPRSKAPSRMAWSVSSVGGGRLNGASTLDTYCRFSRVPHAHALGANFFLVWR
jgi:hypothetical protein